jgi:hypothetical protein
MERTDREKIRFKKCAAEYTESITRAKSIEETKSNQKNWINLALSAARVAP